MSNPTVSIATLPKTIALAARSLVDLGHTKAACQYTLAAAAATAAGLGPVDLRKLLTTGLPATESQKPLLRFYAEDKQTGDVAYSLYYDLVQ